jgi:hypothetical protein
MSTSDSELKRILKSDLTDTSVEKNGLEYGDTYGHLNGHSKLKLRKKLVIVETDLINLNERFIAQSQLFDMERKDLLKKNFKLSEDLKKISKRLTVAEKFYRQIKSENDLIKLNSSHMSGQLKMAKNEIENYQLLITNNNENHECELEQCLKEKDEHHEKQKNELKAKINDLENELAALKEIIEKEACEKIHLYRKALGLECELEWLKSQKTEKNAISIAIDKLFIAFLNSIKKDIDAYSSFTIMDKINFIKYELESNRSNKSNETFESKSNQNTNLNLTQRFKRKRK